MHLPASGAKPTGLKTMNNFIYILQRYPMPILQALPMGNA